MQVDKHDTSKTQDTLESSFGDCSWKTPEVSQVQNSDCYIVGNNLHSLISDESHHSKWEEFRRMAKQESATEECSSLLRRMELEVLEEEANPSDTEMMDDAEQLSYLEEAAQLEIDKEALIMEDQLMNKNLKRRTKWGPTLRAPRPRRHAEDGRTMIEKAQELKKIKNLEKGKKQISSFAFESNANLLKVTNAVNISLGINTDMEMEKVELLKLKELDDRLRFQKKKS